MEGERVVEGDMRVLAGVLAPAFPTAPNGGVFGTTSSFGRCWRQPACPLPLVAPSAALAPFSALDPYGCTGGFPRAELGGSGWVAADAS
eukprot:CAMPEP_0118946226 /NCGR_PEP_ID=MMETSP1169-20130426/43848_1 /TAXON_ID=36882 /ORGANISM="Pyramimonas obovata, Strain CCMP722" /LENGTH=88 /DNA_ID=CAMNT_0006892145 /DNA_START=282 /DNA_END=548 /DNA_ORIENTATION=-